MRSTVTENGQITIPKPIRDRLGIRPGDVLEFGEHPDGGEVARKVAMRSRVDELYGVLRAPGGTDELIESLRGEPDAN
jgi:antitoxin PrlF